MGLELERLALRTGEGQTGPQHRYTSPTLLRGTLLSLKVSWGDRVAKCTIHQLFPIHNKECRERVAARSAIT